MADIPGLRENVKKVLKSSKSGSEMSLSAIVDAVKKYYPEIKEKRLRNQVKSVLKKLVAENDIKRIDVKGENRYHR